MKFQKPIKRKRKIHWSRKVFPLIIASIVLAVIFFFYTVNQKLTPIYLQYAEVETEKIASHVISEAITERISNVLDINDVIEHVPTENSNQVTVKYNTEVINRILADVRTTVDENLMEIEKGNVDILPLEEDIEYDPEQMQAQGGVVFFVSLGQVTNLPLLGNLGPKIPIRFHVIGDAQANVVPYIEEFGINNAYVEVNIVLKVQVKIIVPLATKTAIVEQTIPVAIGLVQGEVPQVFSPGEGGTKPNIEIPLRENQNDGGQPHD